MSKDNDGGPAFPCEVAAINTANGMTYQAAEPGMSLRDWFAGQAMAIYSRHWRDVHPDYASNVALRCYAAADAMLAARSKAP